MKNLRRYVFPSPSDFDYSNFEKVKDLLPEGMGVIGQYGDIFTMTWEMMGFENFSFAMFENPELVIALNNKVGSSSIVCLKIWCSLLLLMLYGTVMILLIQTDCWLVLIHWI
jgi:hypothetical protein